MSTSTPADELRTATLRADYVVVRDHFSNDDAVYKVNPGKGPTERTGTLIHHGDGPADEFVAGLEATGARVERIKPRHLFTDGSGFAKTVDFAPPSSAEAALVAKAAELREQADREDHNDALGGGWGTAGRATRAKAEAFEEALEIVRRYQ